MPALGSRVQLGPYREAKKWIQVGESAILRTVAESAYEIIQSISQTKLGMCNNIIACLGSVCIDRTW